jgi:Uma2 family endonuclease
MLQTLVSVEEYLSTVYRPDVDYVDGHIEKRNVGEKDHSKLQFRIAMLLERMGVLAPFIETRLRVAPDRYRVPDICAYAAEPDEQIFTEAPDLCIEILSPEDRLSRITKRAEDYLALGVPSVWVLDPWQKKAYIIERAGGFREVTGEIAAYNRQVVLTLAEIFSSGKVS